MNIAISRKLVNYFSVIKNILFYKVRIEIQIVHSR